MRFIAVLLAPAVALAVLAGCASTATLNPTGSNVTQTLSQGQTTDVSPEISGSVAVGGTKAESGNAGASGGSGTTSGDTTSGDGTATTSSTATTTGTDSTTK